MGCLVVGVRIDPQSLSWGNVNLGSTGIAQTVTFSNLGSSVIQINSISISGTNSGDFAISAKTCGTSVSASSSCSVTLTFTPQAAGAREATLTINHSGFNPMQTVSLSGTGTLTASTLSVTPQSLAWGSVDLGSTGNAQSVTLSDTGASPINIASIGISGTNAGDFSISSQTCGASLAPSSSCTVTLTFTPVATGTREAALTIRDSGTDPTQTVSLSGTATGKTSTLTVTPPSLSFGTLNVGSASAAQTVTLQSNGTTAISLGSIAVGGADAGDFSIASNSCGSSLAGSSSCSVGIVFNPTAAGVRAATLMISDSASGNPLQVALSGSGMIATSLSIAPTDPTILTNGTLQFTASTTVTWTATCGTINAAGLYLAPSSQGACTVTATGNGSTTPPSVSTSVNVVTDSTGGTLALYPSSVSIMVATSQTFQAQLAGVPDTNPLIYSVDAIPGGNATTGTITTQGVYTAPDVAGSHVLTVQDNTLNKTATAKISVFSDVKVDFGNRSTSLPAISPGLFGAERMESLHDTADLDLVKAGGIRYARLYAQIPSVFKTNSTPDWQAIDFIVQKVSAGGVHLMLQMIQTPTWLQPNPNPCGAGNSDVVPTDLNAWGALAAQYVKHMDQAFPGVVTDYEIWNEPNTVELCGPNPSRVENYMNLYAAAAPQMRAQAAADAQASGLPAARVGGPGTSGIEAGWISEMLSDPVISQNIDFISYHDYLFTIHQTGAQWNTYNGVESVYQRTQDSGTGPRQAYVYASKLVAAGSQPQGKNLPIYNDEYNLNWAFEKNCCANDPTFSPLWNTMYAADMLNAVYDGAANTPGHMVYFAATALPYFCLVGQIDANMDCAYPTGSVPQPYPQYFAYQLLGAANYLDLQDGGNMAKTISPGGFGNGLVLTAFFVKNLDAVVLINPNQNTLSNLTVNLNNTGLTSAQGTLYQIVNGQSIQSSQINLQNTTGTSYTTSVTIGPYSVQAISIHQ